MVCFTDTDQYEYMDVYITNTLCPDMASVTAVSQWMTRVQSSAIARRVLNVNTDVPHGVPTPIYYNLNEIG